MAAAPVPVPRLPEHPPGPPAGEVPAAREPEEGLAGTWLALAPRLPYLALRIHLAPSRLEGHFEGTAVAFDWRGTRVADAPYRLSRPVAVSAAAAARGGATELAIWGPVPMLEASGRPNGMEGSWRVVATSEGDGWQGRLVLTGLTPPEGIPCTLERSFRPWSP